ncbi:MAG: hypothetical protein ACRDR6_17125 [Pseudonocardiaceae bacterium]
MTSTAPPAVSGWDSRTRADQVRERWYALQDWWLSAGGYELRAAWRDLHRAPGLALAVLALLLWPWAGFTLVPVLAGAVLWLLIQLVTWFVPSWWIRRRVRRWTQPAVIALVLGWLALSAGVGGWLITIGLGLIVTALTDTWRARRRVAAWMLGGVAGAARVDPASLRLRRPRWTDRRLDAAEVVYTDAVRDADPGLRERIGEAVSWRLRHVGVYEISWPSGVQAFELRRAATLPDRVLDQLWPPELPGLPIAVTDDRDADLIIEKCDENTKELISRLPVRLWTPDAERHLLVIGGTGAGKTEFVRRLLAVGLRIGLFPGGVFVLDGKSSAGYACFVGREGVHMVAREPHEWLAGLAEVSGIMRARYDAQWNNRLGHGPKPDMPRLALLLEECQEIRAQLGQDADRFYSQLGRQCREAQITLILVTQRPDVKDAIPGAVRDMLEDRIVLGFVSAKGAQMALEEHWRDAVDNYGEETTPGRGVARLAGKYSRIQGLYAGDPIDRPESEQLFPPKVGHRPTRTTALPPSTPPALPVITLDPAEAGTDGGPPDGDHPRQRRRRTV